MRASRRPAQPELHRDARVDAPHADEPDEERYLGRVRARCGSSARRCAAEFRRTSTARPIAGPNELQSPAASSLAIRSTATRAVEPQAAPTSHSRCGEGLRRRIETSGARSTQREASRRTSSGQARSEATSRGSGRNCSAREHAADDDVHPEARDARPRRQRAEDRDARRLEADLFRALAQRTLHGILVAFARAARKRDLARVVRQIVATARRKHVIKRPRSSETTVRARPRAAVPGASRNRAAPVRGADTTRVL